MMSGIIGPSLPSHLINRDASEKDANSDSSVVPNKPAAAEECPAKTDQSAPKPEQDMVHSEIGPTLAPSLLNKDVDAKDTESFGPSLPPGFAVRSSQQIASAPFDDEDDDIIGPLPARIDEKVTTVAEDIEKRSKKMKDRLMGLEEPKKLEREEWMTELPPLLQGFGGGARKFRAHEKVIGDRSVWTDTPADKAKKARDGSNANPITDETRIAMEAQNKRDKEICDMLSNTTDAARTESLLSMHEKERKRQAQEDEASGEAKIRRPFDRDIDLQANQFDDAAKKRFMKQSQGLSSRFLSGATTAKFL